MSLLKRITNHAIVDAPPICIGTVAGLAIGLGSFYALKNADLKYINGWIDLNEKPRYLMTSVAASIGLASALVLGGVCNVIRLINKNV